MAKSLESVETDEKKFVWDDFTEGIVSLGGVEQEDEEVKSRKKKKRVIHQSKIYCPHAYLILNFLDVLNPSEKIKFRKHYLRKVAPTDSDVIILQDIKNLVLFLLITPVSLQFINFFHLRVVDRFLRALIIYFEYYVVVWEEEIIEKKSATMKKAPNPLAGGIRLRRADELKVLRSLLGKEYCELILGLDKCARFHHMLAGTSSSSIQSLGEKDLRIFEVLLGTAHRVVWIALQRKYFYLIEVEMHRLFRTDAYNIAQRKTGGALTKGILEDDFKILHGKKMPPKRKLLRNSPLPQQLISEICDFRVLSLGIIDYESQDPRVIYLKNALLVEEEKLQDLGISVGILGHPRSEYDLMLVLIGSENSDANQDEYETWDRKPSSISDKSKKSNIIESEFKEMPSYSDDQELLETFPIKKIQRKLDKSDEIRNKARIKWISRELQRQSPLYSDAMSVLTATEN